MSRRKKTQSPSGSIEIIISGSNTTTTTGDSHNTTNNGRNTTKDSHDTTNHGSVTNGRNTTKDSHNTTNHGSITNVYLDSHRGRTNNNLNNEKTNIFIDHLNNNFKPFPLNEINQYTLHMEQMLREGNLEFLLSHYIHDVRTVANNHTLRHKTFNRVCMVCKQAACLVCLTCLYCFGLIESYFVCTSCTNQVHRKNKTNQQLVMVNNVLEPHVFHFITHEVTTKSLEHILTNSNSINKLTRIILMLQVADKKAIANGINSGYPYNSLKHYVYQKYNSSDLTEIKCKLNTYITRLNDTERYKDKQHTTLILERYTNYHTFIQSLENQAIQNLNKRVNDAEENIKKRSIQAHNSVSQVSSTSVAENKQVKLANTSNSKDDLKSSTEKISLGKGTQRYSPITDYLINSAYLDLSDFDFSEEEMDTSDSI
jgi:hypothetical protein